MTSGILNIYKEPGFTSFDVVAKLRGILHIRKIGHTGTLDPAAEGVLPICIGKATRVVDLLADQDKVYQADMLLGTETDTQDLTGHITAENSVTVSADEALDAIASFVGPQQQIPPMYSALKVNGRRLYSLARQGIEVERKPRDITIYDIHVVSTNLPHVVMNVHCSKGTYIRTLCHDIGQKLGTGACMASLKRLRVGQFDSSHALKLDDVSQAVKEGRLKDILIPVDTVFSDLPGIVVPDIYRIAAINGARLSDEVITACRYTASGMLPKDISSLPVSCVFEEGTKTRVYLENGAFVGVYIAGQNGLNPLKMFYDPDEDQAS